MSDFAAINNLLDQYAEGIYSGNVDLLGSVFHPQANLYSATGGEYVEMDLGSYLELVANRDAPQTLGQPRTGNVESLDQIGPETAFAKVTLAVGVRHFTDYLTLLKVDNEWGIIAKAFHFELEEPD